MSEKIRIPSNETHSTEDLPEGQIIVTSTPTADGKVNAEYKVFKNGTEIYSSSGPTRFDTHDEAAAKLRSAARNFFDTFADTSNS